VTHKLVETAKRIAPELEKNAAEENTLRRLSDHTWNILMDNGFLRSLQPARWGGGEVSLMEFVDATIEFARVSPSAAWIAGVIGLQPWQLALLDETAQQDMWGKDPPLCIPRLTTRLARPRRQQVVTNFGDGGRSRRDAIIVTA
jgi:3-hydroxy-9,10-secoandrosta-1,3,5(10)-triene-9,17-dione monooxygenase